jgi:hypothetical protein
MDVITDTTARLIAAAGVDLHGDLSVPQHAATLLLVGARDPHVRELNEPARNTMRVAAELRIIATATHLFEEPGTLRQVADQAGQWFADHLANGGGLR